MGRNGLGLDEASFGDLVEQHRRELRVHCYRMLGSFVEAEDVVQETFLRAWKGLAGYEGRASLRTWLYRIATNACLDVLGSRSRRVLPHQVEAQPFLPEEPLPERTDIAWLQPFPDRLLPPVPAGSSESQPEAAIIARETIELAFLATIQLLPTRQRAVLILRDVLGWSAKQTAETLDLSVPAVTSALHRARRTLEAELPDRHTEWTPPTDISADEQGVLRSYMAAVEGADLAAMAALLADEVRTTMPPFPFWFQGRDMVMKALAASWDPNLPGYVGRFRLVPTRANRQPAAAAYVRGPDDDVHRAFGLGVLRIEDGRIAEITAFHDPDLFAAFDLPTELP